MSPPFMAFIAVFLLAAPARAADNSAFGLAPDKGRAVLRSEVYDRPVYPNLEYPMPGYWEVVSDSVTIPALHFYRFDVTPEQVAIIRDALDRVRNLPGISNVKLKVTDHTDSSLMMGGLKLTIAENWALSLSRAMRVAALLREKLDQDENMIVTEGKGGTEPVVSENTPDGKAYTSRVEIQITYEKNITRLVSVSASTQEPVGVQPADPCAVSPATGTASG